MRWLKDVNASGVERGIRPGGGIHAATFIAELLNCEDLSPSHVRRGSLFVLPAVHGGEGHAQRLGEAGLREVKAFLQSLDQLNIVRRDR